MVTPNSVGQSGLLKALVYLAAGLVGGLAGALVGLLVGMDLGGNYGANLQFNGVRGYEAGGQLGALVGFVAAAGLSVALARWLVGRRVRA
jgi:hypothetical protein